ncbi:unnamed protein product [Heligmosomoides polygyrus]|uniref:N-acetyltransferase domain-containing protein n=1 Tax=Heligmosomoides polygyrus TaxID=6339 RepID=A0A183FKH3_HELPZ|nr:unnamed protein product [Heligmosomoides polygyrus]
MQRLTDDDVEVVRNGTPELWDQMRDLVRTLPWTTQDEAMWQLLPEMKNIFPIFAVRKSDNFLLGGVTLVETDIVYGAFYVMRPDLRGLGVGMTMMAHLMDMIAAAAKVKPVLGRGVQAMIEKYSGPPFYAIHHHEMYAFTLPRNDVLNMFPSKGSPLVPKSLKKVNWICGGYALRKSDSEHEPRAIREGVALLDASGNVHGLVGAVPTLHDSDKFKIGPIFAESQDDACYLIKCISDLIPNPEAKFAVHISTNSAGDWMLQKCRDAAVPLVFVGTAANSTFNKIIYRDPCKTDLMYAPMNCPIYFDR